jgi:glutamyl-tRNA reductase
MSLKVLGVDHRSAPASVRENLAFSGECRDRGLRALKSSFPGAEIVLLSTCNRVEVYMAAAPKPPRLGELVSFLARFHRMPVESVAEHSFVHNEEAAIGHLFRVTGGLESLVPGEDQIVGQVRDAYTAAEGVGVIGPIFHTAFQRALRAAERAREETGLGRGKPSIAVAEFERTLADRREQLDRARAIVEREAAACWAALKHRQAAGALLNQLADRTEATVRRELDRLFRAQPGLADTERLAITQAMYRFLNQLLHHPRSALRAAALAGDSADPHPVLDAARRVFGLADARPATQVDSLRPDDPRLVESLVS